jgi:hypothetical protein
MLPLEPDRLHKDNASGGGSATCGLGLFVVGLMLLREGRWDGYAKPGPEITAVPNGRRSRDWRRLSQCEVEPAIPDPHVAIRLPLLEVLPLLEWGVTFLGCATLDNAGALYGKSGARPGSSRVS